MKQIICIIIGIIIGGFGVSLFSSSFEPPVESPQAALEKKDFELRKAKRVIAEYEQEYGKLDRGERNQSMRAKARLLAQQVKRGEELNPNDVFQLMIPMLKDISPLLDVTEQLSQKEMKDALLMSYSRKFGLDKQQLKAVEKHLDAKIEETADLFSEYFDQEGANLYDYAQLQQYDPLLDDELESLMERSLSGEKEEQFRNDRIDQKTKKVTFEADRNLRRLENVVELSEEQKDEAFIVLAKSSQFYSAEMTFDEGVDTDKNALNNKQRNKEIDAILNLKQRDTLDKLRDKQIRQKYENDERYGIKRQNPHDFYLEQDFSF